MVDLVDIHFRARGGGLEFEMEADWIRAQLPAGAKNVLHVGCGGGELFDLLRPLAAVGLDHLLDGLRLTRRQRPAVPLVCGDATRLPFADGSFDLVIAQHVIEHLADGAPALREWYRVLRPAGRLLLLTPSRRFVDPAVFADPTHLRLFDQEECGELLRASGFDVVDRRTIGLPWFRSCGRASAIWRLRRWTVQWARQLSRLPVLRWQGQTLCFAAERSAAMQPTAARRDAADNAVRSGALPSLG